MSDKPMRIQLRRTKGWKMPPNTVKVDRSTRYGNPWPVGLEGPLDRVAPDAEGAVGFFCDMLEDDWMWMAAGYPSDLSPLRGKSLGCWCRLCPDHAAGKPLGIACKKCAPCHADPLGEAVNTVERRNVDA